MTNKTPLDVNTVKNIDPDLKKLLNEFLQREIKYQALRFYSGKVIDNNDPEKLGRCKIRVFGIFGDDIDNLDLPWALPDSHFVGSFVGSLIVPPKNALVRVYFDNGDIYSPIYTTKIPEMKYKSRLISKDYPDTMLFFETDAGDYFTINRKKNTMTFHAAGGAMISINNKGKVTIDTTEADKIYGGGFELNVNGDVSLKTIGNVRIDAVGTVKDIPMLNPLDNPLRGSVEELRTPANSNQDINSTGQVNITSLGIKPFAAQKKPDPTDPIDVALAATNTLKTSSSINIVAAIGDVNVIAMAGNVKLTSSVKAEVIAPSINLTASSINLGGDLATESVIKSTSLATFFDTHIHASLGAPPTIPMATQLPAMVSAVTKTV
jgi:hypothetical protein